MHPSCSWCFQEVSFFSTSPHSGSEPSSAGWYIVVQTHWSANYYSWADVQRKKKSNLPYYLFCWVSTVGSLVMVAELEWLKWGPHFLLQTSERSDSTLLNSGSEHPQNFTHVQHFPMMTYAWTFIASRTRVHVQRHWLNRGEVGRFNRGEGLIHMRHRWYPKFVNSVNLTTFPTHKSAS